MLVSNIQKQRLTFGHDDVDVPGISVVILRDRRYGL